MTTTKEENLKKWVRSYQGFESLNDAVEDLTDEAFEAVIPNGEFTGTITIVVTYTPDDDEECD